MFFNFDYSIMNFRIFFQIVAIFFGGYCIFETTLAHKSGDPGVQFAEKTRSRHCYDQNRRFFTYFLCEFDAIFIKSLTSISGLWGEFSDEKKTRGRKWRKLTKSKTSYLIDIAFAAFTKFRFRFLVNIFPQDGHVVVPIWPVLRVNKAQAVQELVH
jgi:hypothetical protein